MNFVLLQGMLSIALLSTTANAVNDGMLSLALLSTVANAVNDGKTLRKIFSSKQNLFSPSSSEDPPKTAVGIASLGNGGVSLRNADKTPPGPASSQEVLVQYEALCPDTSTFFKGLKEAYADDALRNRFTFELIPYGNTKLPANKKLDNTKPWGGRVCQHGERECWGNAWQACTHATLGSDRNRIVQHTTCLMDLPKQGMPEKYWKNDPWSCGDYMQCVVEPCSGILSPEEKAEIQTCVGKVRNSEASKGTMEMDSHQKAAELWSVSHVPWIVVNGKHVEELDDNKISLSTYLKGLPESAEVSEAATPAQKTSEQPIATAQQPAEPIVDEKDEDHVTSENQEQPVMTDKQSDKPKVAPTHSSHISGTALAVGTVIMLLGAVSMVYCIRARKERSRLAFA